MTEKLTVEIEVVADTARVADVWTDELAKRIRSRVDGTDPDRRQLDETHQDAGTIIALTLGSPVAGLLVREVSAWLKLRYSATIKVTRKSANGEEYTWDQKGPMSKEQEQLMRNILDGQQDGN
ncbi:hypothetical protein [Nocardia bovistercoris]|uniref:Uncharacterized protein n=1 Tax=Nocardia bovistercoris TaxID=2785916 RepID=A0A931N6W5_9NOCA|nr:hypothetical protein [Nocardia bovistercoris]MBH0781414.1 hypothetical protein [Nocardia bovistercoris]